MGSRYLTEMARWFRDAGLRVVEYDGWPTRARSSGGFDGDRPWCVMWHHTASDTTPLNDASYMCHGSSDRPIANVLIARDGEVWVLAGGATNTNGKGQGFATSKGQVPKDSMNTYAVGVEIANNGVGQAFPREQIDAAFLVSVTLTARLGLQPTDACQHQFYAPDRKIDPATAEAVQGPWQPNDINSSGTWSQGDLHAELIARSEQPEPPPDEEEDVQVCEVAVFGIDARFLGYKIRQDTPQGKKDLILWVEWVNGNDANQLWRLQAYRDFGVPVHTLSTIDDMRGVGLIGPVPTGDKTHNWSESDFGNVLTE